MGPSMVGDLGFFLISRLTIFYTFFFVITIFYTLFIRQLVIYQINSLFSMFFYS